MSDSMLHSRVFANTLEDENLEDENYKYTLLSFLSSKDINVYPCGRRNSTIIDGGDPLTNMDNFYYPFDAEARLNTEYNNRSTAGLNGYAQTFVKSFDDQHGLHIVIGGYSFRIEFLTPKNLASFAKSFTDQTLLTPDNKETLSNSKAEEIFANIRIEKTWLYSDGSEEGLDYFTWVLRNQTADPAADAPCLDRIKDPTKKPNVDGYFFSGLSFSSAPLFDVTPHKTVLDEYLPATQDSAFYIKEYQESGINIGSDQIVICLHLFTKNESGQWEIYKNSLLPDVRHGNLDGQAVVGHLLVEGNEEIRGNIKANNPNAKSDFPNSEDFIGKTGAHAHFLHVTVDGDLVVYGTSVFKGNVAIKGSLDVANTIDTKFLVASDAQITGDISRMHGETPMGLVTVELKNSASVQDPDDPKTDTPSITDRTNAGHIRPRLHIYTYYKDNMEDKGPHKLERVNLIDQVKDPKDNSPESN